MIAPWEVQELPLEWFEGARAITTRVGQAKKAAALIDQKLAAWQASHPAYKSRM